MSREMNKHMVLAALCTTALLVGGCSMNTQSNATAESEATTTTIATASSQETRDGVIVNGLELSVDHFGQKKMVDDEGNEQTVYTAHVTGKNVSGAAKGLGAIDFVLTTDDGTEVEVTTDLSSFGNEIESGKSLEGDLYFSLDKKATPKAIAYKPVDDVLYTWNIN